MTTTVITAPDRSLEQRLAALRRANDVRVNRAIVKRQMKAGTVSIGQILLAPPACVETAKVFDMLMAVPKFGRVKAARVLNQCRISQAKTVGGLSERQRGELVRLLGKPRVSHTLIRPRVDFDAEVKERLAGDDEGTFDGWYCVTTDEFPCPAGGCDFIAKHMTAAHRIVVWPSIDDRMMFTYARDAQKFGRNPRIVEYERSFGPCIAYDRWVQIGKPIHAALDDPSGYYDDWKAL